MRPSGMDRLTPSFVRRTPAKRYRGCSGCAASLDYLIYICPGLSDPDR